MTAGSWYAVRAIEVGQPTTGVFGGVHPGAFSDNYVLSVQLGGPPANDNCANAVALTLGAAAVPGSTNTFTNNSGINLFFSNIDLEGVNQTDYSFTTTCGNNNGVALAPGASCTSTTFFSPTVNPAINETTTFVYYANICLVKQGLLINGQGTAVKVSPTSITFPWNSAPESPSSPWSHRRASSSPAGRRHSSAAI